MLPVIERLIDAFRKPKLEPEEREALVAYMRETLRLHDSLNTGFLRLQPIMGIAKLRDDREKLAARWVADGMDYLRVRPIEIREHLTAIVPTVASEVDDASAKHCDALSTLCAAGATSFRALMDDVSDEDYGNAFNSFERAHRDWAKAKRRFDRELNRTLSRYKVSGDEIHAVDPADS